LQVGRTRGWDVRCKECGVLWCDIRLALERGDITTNIERVYARRCLLSKIVLLTWRNRPLYPDAPSKQPLRHHTVITSINIIHYSTARAFPFHTPLPRPSTRPLELLIFFSESRLSSADPALPGSPRPCSESADTAD
jgi:hypothetical protein